MKEGLHPEFYLLTGLHFIGCPPVEDSRAPLRMLDGMRSEEDQIKATPPLPQGDSDERVYKCLSF